MLVTASIPLIAIAAIGALVVVAKFPRETLVASGAVSTESIRIEGT
jgi:AAHS family 3-hydroxyphenylpropionic acid transporter